MKKIFVFLLLFTIALTQAFAQGRTIRSSHRPSGPTFGTLVDQKIVTLNTSVSINSHDTVSTGTADVSLVSPSVVYPVKLRIQNHGTASLTYIPYSTSVSGVAQPTATASHLLSPQGLPVVQGRAFEQVFYYPPNISIGSSGAQEVVIELWGD